MGDEIEAKVLSVDVDDRKISLGVNNFHQIHEDEIEEKYMVGTVQCNN